MLVRDVMRRSVITVRPELPISELGSLFSRKHISGAPVVDGERVVGIVSRSDLIRQLSADKSQVAAAAFYLEPFDSEALGADDVARIADALGTRWTQLRVEDVMERAVLSIGSDASLAEAAARMASHRVHRLVVLEDDRLVGLLSTLDLLAELAAGRLVPVAAEAPEPVDLRRSVERVRHELQHAADLEPSIREELDQIAAEAHAIAQPRASAESHDRAGTLRERLSQFVARLESEHPALTEVTTDLVRALGQMGI